MIASWLPFTTAAGAESGPADTSGVVTVYRDAWGVPHIYAKDEDDGFYALGYSQAEDQAEGILSAALAVEGRAAAVFGKGTLPWGLPVRLLEPSTFVWRHAEQSKAAFERLPAPLKHNQEAYVRGFNAYLAAHPSKRPAWAPTLEPWHLIAIPRAILWFFMVGDGLRECAQAGVPLMADVEAGMREVGTRFASNAWVVSPGRTADGHSMVLSDPHSIINGSLFYEYRMKAGALDVAGYTVTTTMVLTHNADVAWGMTTGGPDVSDCYELELDPKQVGRYRVHGQWRQFQSRSWSHTVRDQGIVEGHTDYAWINGLPAPVVARKGSKAYAIVTPYFDDAGGLLEQTDEMVRATSIEQLKHASERSGLFPQNVLSADRSGTLYYLRDGRVPKRDSSVDWSRVVSGDDRRTRWRGLHARADLVQVSNPAAGYLQNNNTSPLNLVAGPPVLDPSRYADYLVNDIPSLNFVSRARRANELLEAHPQLTVSQAKRIAQDEYWVGTENWKRWLESAVRSYPARVAGLSPDAQRVLSRLRGFDGMASASSTSALAHYFWRTAAWAPLDEPGRARFVAMLAAPETASSDLLEQALSAVERATTDMRTQAGGIDRTYGDYFRVSRDGIRSWPVGGGFPLALKDYSVCVVLEKPPYVCEITQRAMAFNQRLSDGRPRLTEGSRALRLIEFGTPVRTYSLHNYGQSDDPASPHFDDQARLLTSPGAMKEVLFELSDLLPVVASRIDLRTHQ